MTPAICFPPAESRAARAFTSLRPRQSEWLRATEMAADTPLKDPVAGPSYLTMKKILVLLCAGFLSIGCKQPEGREHAATRAVTPGEPAPSIDDGLAYRDGPLTPEEEDIFRARVYIEHS